MDTPLKILQERTNRLNQQFAENEENINRRFSKCLLQELQETNDSITVNTETLIKDLENQLEANSKSQIDKDETISRLKEDIEVLLEMNKSQADEIETLKVRVNEAEADNVAKLEQAEAWLLEQQDLRQEKTDMREEIVRTMEKLSQQKIYAENMEIEYRRQIVELEEKLTSSVHMSEEKGFLIDELIDKYNELKVDFDKEIELRHDQADRTEQIRSSYDDKIRRLEEEIVDLNMQAIEQKKKYEAVDKANAEFSHKIIQGKNEEIDDLLHEITTLKVREAEKSNQIEILEQATADMKTAKLEFETETSNRHMDYFRQLESKIEELNEQLLHNSEKSTQEQTAMRDNYEAKISQLTAAKGTELKELVVSRDQLKTEYDSLRGQLDGMKTQLVDERSQTTEALAIKDEIIRNLNADIKELNEALTLKSQSGKSLNEELNLLSSQLAEATEKIVSLNKDCHDLDCCYKELSEQNVSLQSDYASLNVAYQEKCQAFCDELERARHASGDYLKTIGDLKDGNKDLKDKVEQLGEQVKIGQFHVEQANSEIVKLKDQLGQLMGSEMKELDMLRRMIPCLEAQFAQEMQQMVDCHGRDMARLEGELQAKLREIERLRAEELLAGIDSSGSSASDEQNLIEFSGKSQAEEDVVLAVDRLGDELKTQVELSAQLDEGIMSEVESHKVCWKEYPGLWHVVKSWVDEFDSLKRLLVSKNQNAEKMIQNVIQIIQLESSDLLNEIHYNIEQQQETRQDPDFLHKLDTRESLRTDLKRHKLEESHLRREVKHLQYCKDAEEINTNDLKQLLESEKSKSFELMDRVNELKRKSSTFNEQMGELARELKQVRQLLAQESKQFQRLVSKLEADYTSKLSAFQRQESKFSELENRTKSLQDLVLKKQITYLNDEKSRQDQASATNRCLVQKLTEQNSELSQLNKNLTNELSELHRTIRCLNETNQELKANNQSQVEKRFDLQSTVQTLTNQNGELRSSVLDRNILKISNNTLMEKNRELQSMVQSLSSNNYELKSYINKNQLNKALSDNHKEKFKRLYLKYLRSEAFRKSLVYQKRFLIIILSGYERKEDHQYSSFEYKNQTNRPQFRSFYSKRCIAFKAMNHFKAVVFTIVASIRIRNLASKHRANLAALDSTSSNSTHHKS